MIASDESMTADGPDGPDDMTKTPWVGDGSKCCKQVGGSPVVMMRLPHMQFDWMQMRVHNGVHRGERAGRENMKSEIREKRKVGGRT